MDWGQNNYNVLNRSAFYPDYQLLINQDSGQIRFILNWPRCIRKTSVNIFPNWPTTWLIGNKNQMSKTNFKI